MHSTSTYPTTVLGRPLSAAPTPQPNDELNDDPRNPAREAMVQHRRPSN